MKILILCNSASGLFCFREMLIRKLIENDNTVSAVVPLFQNDIEKQSEEDIRKLGCNLLYVSIDRRGVNPIKDIDLFFNLFKIICKEKPDIVITYTIKPNIYGGIACRLMKIPYAVNITGLGTSFQTDGFVKKLVCIMYKVALKKSKAVFFENIENRDIFVDLHLVNKDKTKVLAGAGVDLEHFSFIEYPENTGETRFLFVGRVMKEKGIDELFGAMKKLQSDGIRCHLDILGGYEEDYAEIIHRYEQDGWLTYHGYQKDVRPFIGNCHCFVLPSWHEGMANTNLENAASGRPVVTSNIHGCLEAVIDGESGFLIEPKSVDSLFNAMKRFIALPYVTKISMGKRGREHMENVFDKKKVVEDTMRKII